jgi:hypothetical protein
VRKSKASDYEGNHRGMVTFVDQAMGSRVPSN